MHFNEKVNYSSIYELKTLSITYTMFHLTGKYCIMFCNTHANLVKLYKRITSPLRCMRQRCTQHSMGLVVALIVLFDYVIREYNSS